MANAKVSSTTKNSEPSSLFFVVLVSVLMTACSPSKKDQALVLSGPIMGTSYRISLVVEQNVEQSALSDELLKIMQSVDAAMSTYKHDSEISRFNRTAVDEPFALSDQTAAVVSEALQLYEFTQGYFDITVGPLVNAWGFGSRGQITTRPAPRTLDKLKKIIGSDKLRLENGSLTKLVEHLSIDLSAIAKGYAVDQLAEFLEQRGIANYLVEIGGELRAAGRNIDQQIWRVGIERPQALGGIQQIVLLQNQSIATSGDYRNFLMLDGQKYSHTIDPIAGKPVLHRLALVSVIADRASTADALATALMAMGEDRAQLFATKHQLAAYFVIRGADGDQYHVKKSAKIIPNLQ